MARVRSFTGPACNACGGSTGASYTYTAAQQISRVTRADGSATAYTYDASGNVLTETEAAGTSLTRTTTTTYTVHNQPATITRPSAVKSGQRVTTAMTYDADGNPLTLTRTGIRNGAATRATITMTYTTLGRIASIDGPRTDVSDMTRFAYYPDTATGIAPTRAAARQGPRLGAPSTSMLLVREMRWICQLCGVSTMCCGQTCSQRPHRMHSAARFLPWPPISQDS